MPLQPLNRRSFLRSSGVAVALPFLDAMAVGSAAETKKALKSPKRLLLVGRPLGLHTPYFFPAQAGRDYVPSRYLKRFQDHRKSLTVFSGMSHRYASGHFAEVGLFTGVSPDHIRPGEIRNSISLDQEVASRIGDQTRFPSLALGGGDVTWNRRGVRIPSEPRATHIFRKLFIQGTPDEQAQELRRISDGKSILDNLRSQVKTLEKRLGAGDRVKLDQYLASIREAEQKLQQEELWSKTPKPMVEMPLPKADFGSRQLLQRSRQWYDIVKLAFQTDSTRVVSLWLGSQLQPEIDGVTLGHHDASHHGQDPTKLEQLALIEEAELAVFAEFLTSMKQCTEMENTLLDRTVILHASNLGNASSHDNTNLPILLAGGGFRHAGHISFDRKENTLLSNLFVRMMHQLEIDVERFGASTGVVSEV